MSLINYRHYIVVRGFWSPADNQEYSIGQNGIIYKGSGSSCSDAGLDMGNNYDYTIYAYYRYPVYDEENILLYYAVDYGSGIHVNVRTKLGGTMSTDMTLTKEENPHIVTSMLNVPSGVTLNIEPGTILKFSGTGSGINVSGTLIADGNLPDGISFDPIYMTSINDHAIGGGTGNGKPAVEDWDAVRFNSESVNNLLRHVIVKWGGYDYSENNPGLVEIYTSSINIANSELSDNQYGIYISNASPRIVYSNVLNNSTTGIYCTGSSSPIIEDTIIDSNGIGVMAENDAAPIISICNFKTNPTSIYVKNTFYPTLIGNSFSDTNYRVLALSNVKIINRYFNTI